MDWDSPGKVTNQVDTFTVPEAKTGNDCTWDTTNPDDGHIQLTSHDKAHHSGKKTQSQHDRASQKSYRWSPSKKSTRSSISQRSSQKWAAGSYHNDDDDNRDSGQWCLSKASSHSSKLVSQNHEEAVKNRRKDSLSRHSRQSYQSGQQEEKWETLTKPPNLLQGIGKLPTAQAINAHQPVDQCITNISTALQTVGFPNIKPATRSRTTGGSTSSRHKRRSLPPIIKVGRTSRTQAGSKASTPARYDSSDNEVSLKSHALPPTIGTRAIKGPKSISEYGGETKRILQMQHLLRNEDLARSIIYKIHDSSTLKNLRFVNRFFAHQVSRRLFDKTCLVIHPDCFASRHMSAFHRISKYVRRFKILIPSTIDITDINPWLKVASDVQKFGTLVQSLSRVDHLFVDALGRHGKSYIIVDTVLTNFKRALQHSPMRPYRLTLLCSPAQVQLFRPDLRPQVSGKGRRVRSFWENITELTLGVNTKVEETHDWARSYKELYKFIYVFCQQVRFLSFKWLAGRGGPLPLTLTDFPAGLLQIETYPHLTFPRLRRIKLDNILVPAGCYEVLFKERAKKLNNVSFKACQLVGTGDKWPSVFRCLPQMRPRGDFDEEFVRFCRLRR